MQRDRYGEAFKNIGLTLYTGDGAKNINRHSIVNKRERLWRIHPENTILLY